jgi:hypothetical protein
MTRSEKMREAKRLHDASIRKFNQVHASAQRKLAEAETHDERLAIIADAVTKECEAIDEQDRAIRLQGEAIDETMKERLP